MGRNSGRAVSARKAVLVATVLLLAFMTVLSIVGAFMGAKKAAEFFNSPPLAALWCILAVLFVAGFFVVKSLLRRPGLLLTHLGCLLVLVGALLGSETAHNLRSRYMGSAKIRTGFMRIHEGHYENMVFSEDGISTLGTLPFAVALEDFWIEFYDAESTLQVVRQTCSPVELPAIMGQKLELGGEVLELEITRTFRDFRISIEDGKKIVGDVPGDGSNPALEVELTHSDGTKSKHYVFAGAVAGHGFSYAGLALSYRLGGGGGIKDYKSALAVIEDDKVVKQKVIEVNKPLHYGGYDFYQTGYDQEYGTFTVLSVASNSGLLFVYAGYILLCAGVIWQFWLRHLGALLRSKATA